MVYPWKITLVLKSNRNIVTQLLDSPRSGRREDEGVRVVTLTCGSTGEGVCVHPCISTTQVIQAFLRLCLSINDMGWTRLTALRQWEFADVT